jgi:hypothetical protein
MLQAKYPASLVSLKAGDIILTHKSFGLFSICINIADYLLYKFKSLIAYFTLHLFNVKIFVRDYVKIDHIARIGDVKILPSGIHLFTLYETIAINKQHPFFSIKRWQGGTIKTILTINELMQHYKKKKIYIKYLTNPLTKTQQQKLLKYLNKEVKDTKEGLNSYSWKYAILSPFDIFFSIKKQPNKKIIKHINYCQMLIVKSNIEIGLEDDAKRSLDYLESPLQEIYKPFYSEILVEIY